MSTWKSKTKEQDAFASCSCHFPKHTSYWDNFESMKFTPFLLTILLPRNQIGEAHATSSHSLKDLSPEAHARFLPLLIEVHLVYLCL